MLTEELNVGMVVDQQRVDEACVACSNDKINCLEVRTYDCCWWPPSTTDVIADLDKKIADDLDTSSASATLVSIVQHLLWLLEKFVDHLASLKWTQIAK